jgi:hypothetical protein
LPFIFADHWGHDNQAKRVPNLNEEQPLRLVQLDQRPMSLLGRKAREEKNWWLVSDIGTLA